VAEHGNRLRNPVKRTLAAGGEAVGAFVRMGCAEPAELLAYAGFQFVVVDAEHALTDDGTIATVVRAAEAAGAAAFVRPPTCDPSTVGHLLETGASGVHLPQANTVATLAAGIAAVKYPPFGARGLATARRAGYGMLMSLAEYIEAANRETLVVAQVETADAIDHVGDIARTPGLDVLFVGLTDLTADLGIPGEYEHPDVDDALARAARAALDARVALGVPVTGPPMLERMRRAGARYFTANDIRLLSDAASSFLTQSGFNR